MLKLQSEEAVPGPSVFPSGEPGVSGDFWGSQEGCQGPFRPSGRNGGTSLETPSPGYQGTCVIPIPSPQPPVQ